MLYQARVQELFKWGQTEQKDTSEADPLLRTVNIIQGPLIRVKGNEDLIQKAKNWIH